MGVPESRSPLRTAELMAISAKGHSIGALTRSYFRLNTLTCRQARGTFCEAQVELDERLDNPWSISLSLTGRLRSIREDLRSYCWDIGVTTIATATPGLQHSKLDPLIFNKPDGT